MYHQIHLYSICRGGYRKIYSGTIRVCEGRVWGVSTTNVRAWNYTWYARLSGHRALQKGRKYLLRMDIQRRAINIPLDFQLEGLVQEINITNCDGTKFKKKHQYHPLKYRNGKGGLRQLRIHKNIVRRGTTKNQIEPDEDGLPELRPKIDFHFLR